MTNYDRWERVARLAELVLSRGWYIGEMTTLGAYPIEYGEPAQLIHALSKDDSSNYGPREDLLSWEGRFTTGRLVKVAAQTLPELVADYMRWRNALVAFLKSE
jgi:hypothetical protein